jgi:16S rRNA (cytidine1402-2'-O)-methyltransferase
VLIVAATPIGNLGDASPRLREHLETATVIAAEDTRTLKQLARGLGINLAARLISLHEHNEGERLAELIEIARDQDLLLVSDAGMPTISDPGFQLLRAAREHEIAVSVIPGPSAVLAALALSGLPTDRFCFEGFLPRKSAARIRAFQDLVNEARTMVFFESPHRIQASLQDAVAVFGPDRPASLSRELTKKFEETVRGSLAELAAWATREPRGEIVLVIAGSADVIIDAEAAVARVVELAAQGLGLKQAAVLVAEQTGLSRSWLYDEAVKHKN